MVPDAHLLEQAMVVVLDGGERNTEPIGDLLVGQTLSDHLGDLGLARGEAETTRAPAAGRRFEA